MLTWAVSFSCIPEKEKDVGQVRSGVDLRRNQLQVAEIMADDFSRKYFKQSSMIFQVFGKVGAGAVSLGLLEHYQ